MKTVTRKHNMLALFLVLAAGLAYGAFTLDLFGIHRRQFSSEEWLAGGSWTRGQMANDLVSSKTLVGKNRGTVVEALGTPDGVTYSYPTDSCTQK